MINATGNRMSREIARQSRLAQDVAQTQIQISTGRRIQRASDDPVASARITALRTAQANDAVWTANIGLGQSLTAQADGVLKTVSDLLGRSRELVTAGANATLAPADRSAIATELTALADEIDALAANQSALGAPLFSNSTASVMRFDADSDFAPVPSRAAIFGISGSTIGQQVRDAATAVGAGTASASLSAIDAAIDQMATTQAQIGINAARLDRLSELQAERGIARAAERSGLEDTDLSSAIAKLNSQTVTLEAAQAAFARINRRTLFDILG
jgi:flagellar hook-associated protein 3 FlgL